MEPINPFALENKSILVTGASSGIGRGIAIACSHLGAKVIITGRNEDRLNETLCKMSSKEHQAVVADLTLDEDISRLVKELPKLDGIVHCAGIGDRIRCADLTREEIGRVMNVNFFAPVLLQAAILANKKLNRSASIVFIASRAYESPSFGNSLYSASKGAVVSYSKCLALELSSRKIRVNCICPGMVWTKLITNTLD